MFFNFLIKLNPTEQIKGGINVGKKHRNRTNSPKKNNHIPTEAIIAEQEAHGKENSAHNRKNKQ
jgi:hypothetical protein